MAIGKISEFDVRSGLWSSYVDRLDMYFKVNKVEDDLKLPTLIASMGDEAYELLVNLASPDKPSDLSYKKVDELMRQHLQPAPSSLAERYRFRQKRQESEEDVAKYVAELKRLSRNCKFSSNLNENLRDQFICGIRSDVIRQRLFAEDDSISFAEAVKLACSLEAAERDAAVVDGAGGAAEDKACRHVHALATHISGSGGARGEGKKAGAAERVRIPGAGRVQPSTAYVHAHRSTRGEKDSCAACGARNHGYENCRYRTFVCSKCQHPGHLRRVCPEWNTKAQRGQANHRSESRRRAVYFGDADQASSEEEENNILENMNLLSLNNYEAVSLPVLIDKTVVNMEIDTGTAISCISRDVYDTYFSHLPIEKDNTILKFYDGTKIKPLGIIRPTVKYKFKEKQLELFIIKGGTTSLIGRQWLAELQIDVPKFHCRFMDKSSLNDEVCKLIDRYKEVFSEGLGRYTGGKASLRVREGAQPVFHRARPLPYALRDRVDAELDAMLRAGVIEPVECSDWASPLVPVNKADGTLRICADYKSTLNPVLLIDRYPLPKIEDVLMGLNGAKFFSKIDLSHAYNQIELDESKKYTVINTHRGLFRYNRLVYGLSSSVGIFQRIMTNILQGIPHVHAFLDDVIIGGGTKAEHLQALEAVFKRLADNGLRVKKNKCVFLVDEVKYLGYIVSKEGIKADMSKIDAIVKIKSPVNVTELRSFLGMVNFFGRFIKNLSSLLVPLHKLLGKGVPWIWSRACERAFEAVKRALVGSEVLAHYEPGAPLVVTCDASARGLGAVLAQRTARGERPVAYASRSLTDAERNYSQIHREALAIIFCVKIPPVPLRSKIHIADRS